MTKTFQENIDGNPYFDKGDGPLTVGNCLATLDSVVGPSTMIQVGKKWYTYKRLKELVEMGEQVERVTGDTPR